MSDSLILGIDTSTAWRSLGLIDDRGLVGQTTLRLNRGGPKGLIPLIHRFLEDSGKTVRDLTGIGVANGPGSFTALRVGVSAAQGFGMGAGIPVVPVSTPEAVAQGVPPAEGDLLVLVPARKGQVFAQTFDSAPDNETGWRSTSPIECVPLEEIRGFCEHPNILAGPGVAMYREDVGSLYGQGVKFAPTGCCFARGETVAEIASRAIREGTEPYLAERVEIRYLQSHGALTIAEREAGRTG